MPSSRVRCFILLVLNILVFSIINGYSQNVPQGIKYQTTVRNDAGVVVPNQSVKLRFSFYSGSASGTLQWEETQLVQTDVYGLATIVIGNGTNTGAGAAASFSQINWSLNVYYLKIAIDATGGNNFVDMGTGQLFSVPYAFYSLKTDGINSFSLSQFQDVNLSGIGLDKLLKWNGTYWVPSIDKHSDTVLFAYSSEHANTSDTATYVYSATTSDTVLFAYQSGAALSASSAVNVTNTNSSVYSDTATYAFASAASAWQRSGNTLVTSQKYIGTNDSKDLVFKTTNTERFRIKANGNLNIGSSSNSAVLSLLGADGFLETGTFGTGTLSATGAGVRMNWYPAKAFFMVGGVSSNQWDDVNIGKYSFVSGYNSSANNYSFASGYACVCGDYTIAMGRKCQATDLGDYPNGTGIALGDSCLASANRTVAIGLGNVSSRTTAVTIGQNNTASESVSLALGSNCRANGTFSTVIGYYGSSNSKNGGFVYADASSTAVTNATAAYQFLVRASGGTIFYTDAANTMGVSLAAGSGSWANVSDVHKKGNFENVDPLEILKGIESLKIKSWNYKSQSASIRHIGPMAQDFHRIFGFGENNTTITGVDMDGVIIKGIQALNFRIENLQSLNSVAELKNKIDQLDDSSALNKRLDIIEAALNKNSNK